MKNRWTSHADRWLKHQADLQDHWISLAGLTQFPHPTLQYVAQHVATLRGLGRLFLVELREHLVGRPRMRSVSCLEAT